MPKALPLAASDSLNNQSSSSLDEIQETKFVIEAPESSSAHNIHDVDNIQVSNDRNKLQILKNSKDIELSNHPSLSEELCHSSGSSTSQFSNNQQLFPSDKQMQKQKVATNKNLENNYQQVSGYDMLIWTPSPSGLLNLNKIENSNLTTLPLENNKHYNPPPSYLGVDIGRNEDSAFNNDLLDISQNNNIKMPFSTGLTLNDNLQMKICQDVSNLHKAPCQHGIGGKLDL